MWFVPQRSHFSLFVETHLGMVSLSPDQMYMKIDFCIYWAILECMPSVTDVIAEMSVVVMLANCKRMLYGERKEQNWHAILIYSRIPSDANPINHQSVGCICQNVFTLLILPSQIAFSIIDVNGVCHYKYCHPVLSIFLYSHPDSLCVQNHRCFLITALFN